MELEEYKIRSRKQVVIEPRLQVSDLQATLQSKSPTLTDKLLRSLQLEMAFTILFIAAMFTLLLWSGEAVVKAFAIGMLAYGGIFLYVMVRLNRRVSDLADTRPVKTALQQLIKIISSFIRIYFQLTLVMVPVIIICGFAYGLPANVRTSLPISALVRSSQAWTFLLVSLGWYAMMYFITRWYTRKLYGIHLSALRQQLSDLEQ